MKAILYRIGTPLRTKTEVGSPPPRRIYYPLGDVAGEAEYTVEHYRLGHVVHGTAYYIFDKETVV